MNRTRAFTLLELLLATVLLAVLMIGVLSVVARLSTAAYRAEAMSAVQRSGAAASVPDIERDIEPLIRLLRDDLEHASHIDASRPNQVTLSSHCALDRITLEPTHRPALVSYSLEELDGRTWLIRRQAALDAISNEPAHRALVCAGVKIFQIEATGASATAASTIEAGASASQPTPGSDAASPAAALQPGPDDTVVVNGVSFYRRLLPPQLLRELDAAAKGSGGAPNASQPRQPALLLPSKKLASDRPPDTIWRLRIQFDGAVKEPPTERVVSVRRIG